jgi:uncharacterized LabA/DUF88 family protein
MQWGRMQFYNTERIALFIDGANLYAASKALGIEIDFKRLLDLFAQRARLVRALYYTAVVEDQEYSAIRPLVDWLSYNGFTVVTKPAKAFTDAEGRRKTKRNMEVEIAVDAMRLAPYIDHVVLFSGDGDFRRLVEALQERGRRVSVVSCLMTNPPLISDDLRRQADQFIELASLEKIIGREQGAKRVRSKTTENS